MEFRKVFDTIPEQFDQYRVRYSEELFASLIAYAGIGPDKSVLELGLINSLTVLALFLSYSMLNVCDLSTDGCFTLGAAVGAVVTLSGHPYLAIPAAMAAGVASGFITAFLQTRMGINSLLSGIIVNTGLYSVNIAVMGGASLLNMNKAATVFSDAKSFLLNILMPFCNRIEGALAGAAAKLFRLGGAEEVRAGVTAATEKVFDFIAGWHKVIVAFIFVALTVISLAGIVNAGGVNDVLFAPSKEVVNSTSGLEPVSTIFHSPKL